VHIWLSLWGLYQELCLAKNQGVLKLEVQMDSAVIVSSLSLGREGSKTGWTLIKKIKVILIADWDVKIIHVYPKANWYADVLGNMGCVAKNM